MAGEKQNIIQAVKNYGKQLFGFIRSRVHTTEEAEDILQDVWVQLSSQARLDDIISVSGWLYRVAKNKITDNYRRKKTDSFELFAEDGEEYEWSEPALMTDRNVQAETEEWQLLFRQQLAGALEELPEDQRSVFIRHEMNGMTLQEIAALENENIKTIISRKRYAVQHLRKKLEVLNNDFLYN
ncbi:MAG: RNA polymerase sigma factor [Chitinophagaceae bacterium]|nr:RNA polymerase sigma factor [Chitinophagaceae bacterium]